MKVLMLCALCALVGSCAPALTQVPDRHPARATAASTPLPEVASMISSGEDEAPAAPPSAGHHHHHHGGAGE